MASPIYFSWACCQSTRSLKSPMVRVLESISLDHETKAVLLGADRQLRPLCDLMPARESGNWTTTADCVRKLGLSESEVAEFYWQAMQRAPPDQLGLGLIYQAKVPSG
jgi:hypothetical protein